MSRQQKFRDPSPSTKDKLKPSIIVVFSVVT